MPLRVRRAKRLASAVAGITSAPWCRAVGLVGIADGKVLTPSCHHADLQHTGLQEARTKAMALPNKI